MPKILDVEADGCVSPLTLLSRQHSRMQACSKGTMSANLVGSLAIAAGECVREGLCAHSVDGCYIIGVGNGCRQRCIASSSTAEKSCLQRARLAGWLTCITSLDTPHGLTQLAHSGRGVEHNLCPVESKPLQGTTQPVRQAAVRACQPASLSTVHKGPLTSQFSG